MSIDIFADSKSEPQPANVDPAPRDRVPWSTLAVGIVVAILLMAFFPQQDSLPKPIDETGLHVLIVEETEKRGQLSDLQRQALLSVEVREWLDQNCANAGEQPASLVVDSDTQLASYGEIWSKLREHATPPYPCVVVSDSPHLVRKDISSTTGPDELIQLIQDNRGE